MFAVGTGLFLLTYGAGILTGLLLAAVACFIVHVLGPD